MSDPKREGPFGPGGEESAPASSVDPGQDGNGHTLESQDEPATLGQALDRIDALRARLEERDAQAKEAEERYLRERAELENFKRRMQREKAEALRYAGEGLVREILPVLDNLERAVRAAQGTASSDGAAALITGVEMVLRQLAETLERAGVSRTQASGQAFDPTVHEAVAQVERSDLPAGTVVDELVPGYRFHDRLLRAAQVSVSKAPSPPEN